MKWYHFIATFLAGAFLTNALPHMVQGVTGNPFPTPFADPPTVGLSSPMVNVLWAGFNLLIGYFLLRVSKLSFNHKLAMLILFGGIMFAALGLSYSLSQ